MPKTFAFHQISPTLMIACQRKAAPDDAEWDGFLDALARLENSLPSLRLAVFTEGGGPTAAQRSKLSRTLGGKVLRVAVVTESAASRFVVSTIALFMPQIATFHPRESARAYAHLALSLDERSLLERAVVNLSSGIV